MKNIEEQIIKYAIHINRLRNSELDYQRLPMTVEDNLMTLVRQGKYKEIKISPFEKIDNNLGLIALDPVTRYTYIVISAITLFTRIAIEEGVVPDDVFDLSDSLLFFLSFLKTTDEIHDLYQTAATMFAKQIHQAKEEKQSYQISRVQNYIARNIFKKITLQEIADYVGLSTNYLCGMFSRETNMSLHNYIQCEKIKVACNLLEHTDNPISQIATYLGFQTQSNFTSVFRKWQKETPTQYREKHYREVY